MGGEGALYNPAHWASGHPVYLGHTRISSDTLPGNAVWVFTVPGSHTCEAMNNGPALIIIIIIIYIIYIYILLYATK